MTFNPKQKPNFWRIFTDGASSGNPGPAGWGAILVSPTGQVSEMGGGESYSTNNRMELQAAIEALRKGPLRGEEVDLFTDSTYVIRGITQWIGSWKKRGWISSQGEPVANTDLWNELDTLSQNRLIHWHYVPGHSGIAGNERADEIAVLFSRKTQPHLYSGPLSEYPIDLAKIHPTVPLKDSQAKKSTSRTSGKKAYSYLSCVNQKPQRHLSWQECERRVRGQKNARFRKALSAEEELSILSSWGFSPTDLD